MLKIYFMSTKATPPPPALWYLLPGVKTAAPNSSIFLVNPGVEWSQPASGKYFISVFPGASGSSPSSARRLLTKCARFISTRLIIKWWVNSQLRWLLGRQRSKLIFQINIRFLLHFPQSAASTTTNLYKDQSVWSTRCGDHFRGVHSDATPAPCTERIYYRAPHYRFFLCIEPPIIGPFRAWSHLSLCFLAFRWFFMA